MDTPLPIEKPGLCNCFECTAWAGTSGFCDECLKAGCIEDEPPCRCPDGHGAYYNFEEDEDPQ